MCIGVRGSLLHIYDILLQLDRHEVAVGWTHALLVIVDLGLGLARTQAKVINILAELSLVGRHVTHWRIDTILLKPVLGPSNQLVQVVDGFRDEDDGLNVWRAGATATCVLLAVLHRRLVALHAHLTDCRRALGTATFVLLAELHRRLVALHAHLLLGFDHVAAVEVES